MRTIKRLVLTCCLGLAAFGCSDNRGGFGDQTVDVFHGKVTQNGTPVAFAENEQVELGLYHETGKHFGIPVKPDGTFDIGWMPTGKYTVMVERTPPNAGNKGASHKTRYNVPDSLIIEKGKADYVIELGKDFQP